MPKLKTRVWGDNEARKCCLCMDEFHGMGNNPEPLATWPERCCDDCNNTKVIPARLADAQEKMRAKMEGGSSVGNVS